MHIFTYAISITLTHTPSPSQSQCTRLVEVDVRIPPTTHKQTYAHDTRTNRRMHESGSQQCPARCETRGTLTCI